MSKVDTTWRVTGMHCPGCERAILRAVEGLEGIERPRADHRAGTLAARWDSERTTQAELAERIASAGYGLLPPKEKRPAWRRALGLLATLAALVVLYALLTLSPLKGILSAFPTARAGMSLGALFTLGLMTSPHCVAMCGGINLAQSAASAQSGRGVTGANLAYNLGRVISYTAIGALVGALGSALRLDTRVQAGIQIAAAAFMVLMALNLLEIEGLRGFMPTLPGGLRARLMGRGGRSSLAIGLLNGLMPCGPLQAMQLYALSAGSWRMGALSMLCFSLGTVPLMLGFGWVSGRLNRRFAKPMRLASGALVMLMGLSMLSNGLSLAGLQPRLGRASAGDVASLAEDAQLVESELEWRGYPDITVKAGVPVRWVIHAEENRITGCNNEMVIPALDLRVPLSPGDNVVEFTADAPGVIPYTCWMGMLRGTITVEE